ncbi:hypothetical protein VCHE09_0272, partial [Vibrio paracholerae HE-09]
MGWSCNFLVIIIP